MPLHRVSVSETREQIARLASPKFRRTLPVLTALVAFLTVGPQAIPIDKTTAC
jgi:hypothetical protein